MVHYVLTTSTSMSIKKTKIFFVISSIKLGRL